MFLARRIGVVLVVALFSFSCASGGLGGGVSLEQEWQLGNQMAAQVAQQMQLVNDPAALSYVRQVGERIHAATPEANLPFDFEIVNDPSINAFSLPGGHVYVNTGLIANVDHADELASVIAHEISHVVARHVIKQVQQQQEISIIGSILLGQNPGALQQIVAEIVAGGVIARFSRADEKQADDMGLQFMAAAGYNPEGMLRMFQKLLAMEKTRPDAVSRFFQDHPGTQDRINDITSRLRNMRATGITDEPGFQQLKSRIR